MTRRDCSLHGHLLAADGSCAICRRLEKAEAQAVASAGWPTLNHDAAKALTQAIERAKSYPRRKP